MGWYGWKVQTRRIFDPITLLLNDDMVKNISKHIHTHTYIHEFHVVLVDPFSNLCEHLKRDTFKQIYLKCLSSMLKIWKTYDTKHQKFSYMMLWKPFILIGDWKWNKHIGWHYWI